MRPGSFIELFTLPDHRRQAPVRKGQMEAHCGGSKAGRPPSTAACSGRDPKLEPIERQQRLVAFPELVDPRERGRQAAALLLQRLDEPDAPPRRTVAPVQLRIRESSAARPN